MDLLDPTHRALVTRAQKCQESQRQGDSTEIAKTRKPPCLVPRPGEAMGRGLVTRSQEPGH